MKLSHEKSKPPRVMLVDDSDTDLFINETMIKYAQFSDDILSFTSSTKALEYIKTFTSSVADLKDLPDVIFLDINMPLMNGFETTRKIRLKGINIPIIALTAFARSEDRINSFQAGFQIHIAKPVNANELVSVVSNLIKRKLQAN